MSGDEIFALIVSLVIGFVGWQGWLVGMFFIRAFGRSRATQTTAIVAPLLAAVLMLFVLLKWASHDVRNDLVYVGFYLAMWFGWLGAAQLILPFLGFSPRDDLFERRNSAAALAIGGVVIGITLAFAGGNIGDGPGWWVVVFSGGLSTGALLLLWLVGNMISQAAEIVTVDRDVATGWRVAGYFIGGGFIVGRAAAGNWHSAGVTITDFIGKGWPLLIVWGLAISFDVMWRPSSFKPTRSVLGCGVFPALLLITVGVIAALLQGDW